MDLPPFLCMFTICSHKKSSHSRCFLTLSTAWDRTFSDSLVSAGLRQFSRTRPGNLPIRPGRWRRNTSVFHAIARSLSKKFRRFPFLDVVKQTSHLYLWCPNALLPEGLAVMKAWGFKYKSNIVWHKIRKDGGSDGRGVGFYFRNVTELILFGVRGKNARTLAPGRRQVNLLATRKREHSRKPDEQYEIIEACSPGPFLELFARGTRRNWAMWGNQADENYRPTWKTYAHHSQALAVPAE